MKRVPPSNHSISEWNFLNSLRYSSKWQPGALLGVMDWYGIDVDWNSHAGELVLSWFTWDSWDSPAVLQCFRSFVSASHFGRQPFEQWNQMIPGHHLQKNGRFKSLRIWETFLFQYIHPTWPNSYGDVRAAEVFFFVSSHDWDSECGVLFPLCVGWHIGFWAVFKRKSRWNWHEGHNLK